MFWLGGASRRIHRTSNKQGLLSLLGIGLCLAFWVGMPSASFAETKAVGSFANEMAFGEVPNFWSFLGDRVHEGVLKYSAETVATAVMSILASMGIGFSLMRTGKKGWGWFAITMIVASLAFLLRFSISLFREVAVTSGPNDWDEA